MGIEQIDQVLDTWEARLRSVDENLLALEGEPTYEMLAGAGGAPRAPLDGVTRGRVYPALDALAELFEHRQKLTEVFEQAKAIRASISPLTFWNTDEKLAEVEKLLNGPSIRMTPVHVPLARRRLLDPAGQDETVAPEQLLAAMAQAYDVARSAVLEVKHAWETLEPAIDSAQQDVTALRGMAASLGVDGAVAPELEELERELKAARTKIARDPLGVSGGVTGALVPRVAELRDKLTRLASLRDRVATAIVQAKALLARIDEIHAAAATAKSEGPRDVEEAARLPALADGSGIEGLTPWLAKLEGTARAGRWQSAEVGLERWFEAAREFLAGDRAVKAAYDGLVARRAEIAGRLGARRAQARSLAARGSPLDPAEEARGAEAEALLNKRPTPLERAAKVVDAFEAAVVARSRK
jgi:hypothetical protein